MIWAKILRVLKNPLVRETIIVIAVAIAEDFVRRKRQPSSDEYQHYPQW